MTYMQWMLWSSLYNEANTSACYSAIWQAGWGQQHTHMLLCNQTCQEFNKNYWVSIMFPIVMKYLPLKIGWIVNTASKQASNQHQVKAVPRTEHENAILPLFQPNVVCYWLVPVCHNAQRGRSMVTVIRNLRPASACTLPNYKENQHVVMNCTAHLLPRHDTHRTCSLGFFQ